MRQIIVDTNILLDYILVREPFYSKFKPIFEKSLTMRKDVRKLTLGTPFQQKVWKVLQTIPYGETRTYKWVAQKIGKPKAVRAVGQACGANPLPLIIPCHRVVASGNKLGGFSGGLRLKKKLLRREGIIL